MTPPLLTADAPVANIAHPREVEVLVLFWYELDFAAFDHFDRGLCERCDVDEPLLREPRLDDGAGTITPRHHEPMVLDLLDEADRSQICDDAFARGFAIETTIPRRHVVVEVRIRREDVD